MKITKDRYKNLWISYKGQYPNYAKIINFSFDILNCTRWKYNPKAQLKQKTIDTVNEQVQENNSRRRVDKYWACQKRKRGFPKVLDQVFLTMIKSGLAKRRAS